MANYNDAFKYSLYPSRMSNPRYDINIQDTHKDTIPATLVIDSSRRNRDLYENPGHYVFRLPTVYKDVISVELMQANVPNSAYSINARNNQLRFTYDNDNDGDQESFTATLTPGNYTETTLATEIAEQMNNQIINDPVNGILTRNVDADRQFGVTYDSVTQRLTITAPRDTGAGAAMDADKDEVTITAGGDNGADELLGLGHTTLTSTTRVLTMPYSTVVRPDRYVVMEVQGMERCDGNSNALMNCFCIIPMDAASTGSDFLLIKDGDTIDNDTYIYHFPEPLPKLAKMEITFRAADGTEYDFNGRDHFLVFEIRCLNRPVKVG